VSKIFALALALCLPSVALASEDCAKLEEPLDRLACYDEESGRTPEVETIEGEGKWSVTTEISKIDDSKNVFLSLKSDAATACPYDDKTHIIWVACRENTTSLWIDFGGCFMSDNSGKGKVTYRLDKDKAAKVSMSESNDNSALGLWRGRSSIPFVRGMLGKSSLLIRAQPFSDSTVTAEYDIRGLNEAIKPLMEACGWTASAPVSAVENSGSLSISEAELEEERRLMVALNIEERQRQEQDRREQEARELAQRKQQLAQLNVTIAPEMRADAIVNTPAMSQINENQTLASILGAASNAAQSAHSSAELSSNGGEGLSPSESQAVLNQLRRCWRVDMVSKNALDRVVTMRVQIRQNGFLNQGTISLVSPIPVPSEYQIAVDRARTALQDLRCQPFALPPQKYNAWREILIRFDPAQMSIE